VGQFCVDINSRTRLQPSKMTTELSRLIRGIQPERTVLFFGAGSSIPSRAPSVTKLISVISSKFRIDAEGFSLSELTGIVEERFSRKELIETIRPLFRGLRPTGGILNLPLFSWRSIFTTNYDDLVEQCYRTKGAELAVYSSNFDFTVHGKQNATKLFKLHGTYEKDISDGHQTRLILTESDYDQTSTYRESLYDRLKSDLAGGHLIIIGHSLPKSMAAHMEAERSLSSSISATTIERCYSKSEVLKSALVGLMSFSPNCLKRFPPQPLYMRPPTIFSSKFMRLVLLRPMSSTRWRHRRMSV
jgi:hypothetical protein